jgi:hypothetical protein
MRKTLSAKILIMILFFAITLSADSQELPGLKLKNKTGFNENKYNGIETDAVKLNDIKLTNETFQLKKRKTVNSYFGAGYSFVIFTNSQLNEIYPILDTRNGGFSD